MVRPRKAAALGGDEGNRRAELLRAAGRLFRQKGYEATTIRDIAAAVGMRSGSPFYHFKSKQELLKTVMTEGLSAALDAQAAAIAAADSPRAAFRAMVRAHLATVLGPGADFIPVLLYDWRCLDTDSRAEVKAIKDRYEALCAGVLVELKRAGGISDDGKLTRLFMFGALNWVSQWYKPEGEASIDDIADAAVAFIAPENSV